jgi:hypothetical protein
MFFVDAPTARVPSRVPLKRADVSQLPDIHHFGMTISSSS